MAKKQLDTGLKLVLGSFFGGLGFALAQTLVRKYIEPGLNSAAVMIPKMNIEQIARLAHPVAVANANNRSWLADNLDKQEISLEALTPQQLGNHAAIALLSNQEPYKSRCLAIVEAYKSKYQ